MTEPKQPSFKQSLTVARLNRGDKYLGSRSNADNVDSFFQRLRKLMPRDSPRISAHKIRHTTATQLANRVKNLKVVQQQLGHSSILTTYCYVHPDMESMREAIAGL